MVQYLRACDTQLPVTVAPWGPMPSFCLYRHLHTCAHTHIHMKKKKTKFKKEFKER